MDDPLSIISALLLRAIAVGLLLGYAPDSGHYAHWATGRRD